MATKKRICVIGAGPSGLPAIKSCLEEYLDVLCFEKSDGIGGLWRYRDADEEGQPSVMKTTIINTSKEMSGYSDFPPPKEYANFMHNSYMFQYFKSYAEHFGLMDYIKLRHEVTDVDKHVDYDASGKWNVSVKSLTDGSQEIYVFDGVMVCAGHHIFPNIPTFPVQSEFQGKIMHTHSLKSSSGFENLNVLVVGIGNSGVDAAVDLSRVAKKVYLSSRRGAWIFPRVSLMGLPLDIILQRRVFDHVRRLGFFGLANAALEFFVNERFNHAKYKLKPKHRALSAHITISDYLPNCILSGQVVVKQDLERFKKDGVVFQGENETTEIDAVVFATGYIIKYSFLSEKILQIEKNELNLYKLMFPPKLPHASLAFIGLVQPLGCIFPISEAQSRWYAQLIRGKLKLPNEAERLKEITSRKKQTSDIYVPSPRHTIQVYYVHYMDEICAEFGAKPNLLKLLFNDPKLFLACYFGPCTPYQYRLIGPHVWPQARESILSVNDRVEAPLNTCIRD